MKEEKRKYGLLGMPPFGRKEWSGSQVINLLAGEEPKGNCFALAGLFKILSDRLNAGAMICTAPQHIYIQTCTSAGIKSRGSRRFFNKI